MVSDVQRASLQVMRLFCTHVVHAPAGVAISLIGGPVAVGVARRKLKSPALGPVNLGGGSGLCSGCESRGGQASRIITSVLPGLVRVHGAALAGGAGIVVAVEILAVFGVPKQFEAVRFLARQAEKADALATQSAAATIGAHVNLAARGRRAGAVMAGVSISKSGVTLGVIFDGSTAKVLFGWRGPPENARAFARHSSLDTQGAHL